MTELVADEDTVRTATSRVRRLSLALAALAFSGALFFVATMPVATRQGINYEVSVHRVPLYLKTFDFLYRSGHYQLLADETTGSASTEQERVLAVFDWTQRNVRETPEGWTVVDDHILNIIIRGHGASDQRADVFATLCTYAGIPAFWTKVEPQGLPIGLILSFALVDSRWVVFDVANRIVFRNDRGELATANDLRGRSDLIPPAERELTVQDIPYPRFLEDLRLPAVPSPLRAELQMPLRRLRHELGRALGAGENDGPER
ncbi:MAG: transglutaminase domain-containing protein [SAR202 cluster bacterium]|jgi:hypothetical protein|nr:transglutaminase domain-containing protein [SAR202 cluster bacterium]MQG69824.1 transglutaminase domain-containing protein [SAR202 cluster bacterium]HAL46433.1 hypothetical protein [Dehalococcoidia bacterium]|tara:strand:+ start:677 stop:1459 length:783 start_codon:yes stop_codon:yes gene_type:complete